MSKAGHKPPEGVPSAGLSPIAKGLWTDEPYPHLIGGRRPDGEIVFPIPDGDSGAAMEPVTLSRRGKLWSWTRQDFEPKEPYVGLKPFRPYLIGYVELPEVIVETLIVGAELSDLKLGMTMELSIVPFDNTRAIFAFRPEPTQ